MAIGWQLWISCMKIWSKSNPSTTLTGLNLVMFEREIEKDKNKEKAERGASCRKRPPWQPSSSSYWMNLYLSPVVTIMLCKTWHNYSVCPWNLAKHAGISKESKTTRIVFKGCVFSMQPQRLYGGGNSAKCQLTVSYSLGTKRARAHRGGEGLSVKKAAINLGWTRTGAVRLGLNGAQPVKEAEFNCLIDWPQLQVIYFWGPSVPINESMSTRQT